MSDEPAEQRIAVRPVIVEGPRGVAERISVDEWEGERWRVTLYGSHVGVYSSRAAAVAAVGGAA